MDRFERTVRLAAVAVAGAIIATLAPLAAGVAAAQAGPPSRPGDQTISARLATVALTAPVARSEVAQNRAAGLPTDGAGSLRREADGAVVANARLTAVDASAEAALQRAGARILARSTVDHLVTVAVQPADIVAVGSLPQVEWLEEVLTPAVHGLGLSGLEQALAQAGVDTNATCGSRVVSEADTQLGVAAARTTYGVDGTGIRIGILSDSYDNLGGASADVAAGELPGPGNPCGRTSPVVVQSDLASGGSDEGRAMAQAVHDLAPGAELLMATAFVSDVDFANQIRGLAAAGATVIVDDISYFNEPVYQDGIIAKAVADVTAAGVTYFSSAGNSNLRLGGQDTGSYEAPSFRPMGCPATIVNAVGNNACHDWNPAAGTDANNQLTLGAGGQLLIKLGYDEAQFGVATDLDLFLLDSSDAILAQSIADNPGSTRQAYELLSYTNTSGSSRNVRLVVGRYASTGTPRFKVIYQRASGVTAVEWNTSASGDVVGPTAYGHNMMRNMGSTAAIAFDATNAPETFSSRGPATYCWGPVVGTTAASRLPACQTTSIHVTATDGAANSFFGQLFSGVWRFFGTSQAAPHAAAVAVLQLQHRPCRTPAEVLSAQRTTAVAIGAFGADAVGGGRLAAGPAIAALAPCADVPGAPTGVTGTPGNGQVSLSWTAPSAVGSDPISGYTVTPFIGSTAQAPQVFASTATAQVVTGLTNGTAYTFRVAATSAAGTGANSVPSVGITPRTVPGAPTGITASPGDGSATVSWNAPASNGGSPITGYTVTPFIGATAQTPQVFASTARTQIITGLANGTAYTFRVAATNAAGTGTVSAPSAAVTPAVPVIPWAPFASWGAMVDRFYLDLLGRAPNGLERAIRVAQLDDGTITPGSLVAALRGSDDHVNSVDPVTRLYRAYFLRIPDPGGLTYWIRQRRVNGLGLNPISSTFAASSEFRNRYGTLTNRAFVELVYQNVLGRPGEASGVAFWTGRLDRGVNNRGQVMTGFSESSEYKRTQAAEVDVSILFILLTGSAPTTVQFGDLVAELEAGTTDTQTIAQAIIDSPSYAARIGG